MCAYLEDDVSLLQVSIFCSQPSAGHLLDEDLAPQAKTVLYKSTPQHTVLSGKALFQQPEPAAGPPGMI